MYPPPYHNPIMKAGEWKVWLESALNSVRNLDATHSTIRSSGSQILGSTWTELLAFTVSGNESIALLSAATGGYDPLLEMPALLMHMDEETEYHASGFTSEFWHRTKELACSEGAKEAYAGNKYGRHNQLTDSCEVFDDPFFIVPYTTWPGYGQRANFFDETGKLVTPLGGIVTAAGRFFEAAYCNGGAKVLFVEDNTTGHSDFYINGEMFTVEFWLKLGDDTQDGYVLYCANAWCVKFDGPNDTITYGTYLAGTSTWEYKTSAECGLSTGAFAHIAVTNDGDKLRIFADGKTVYDDLAPSATTANNYIIIVGNDNGVGTNPKNIYVDELRILNGVAVYTSDFTPPNSPFDMTGVYIPCSLRVKINGSASEEVQYPAIARHFFRLANLVHGDEISVEAKFGNDIEIDWWTTYEASSDGVDGNKRLRYPSPEYINDDPRWYGYWTDIYKMLVNAEGRTPGVQKSIETDTATSDAFSYAAATAYTLCAVNVNTTGRNVRLECYSRSLFTAFELHKDGAKIADLSIFTQRGKDGALTESTLCHDIVFVECTEGSHEFVLKGLSTTTESGHMEAQLHVIY